MGKLRIKVVQPRYGSTAGFWGMTDIPIISIVIIIDYLMVGPDSAPGDWVMVQGI